MDNISALIILRALYLYKLLQKGWSIKKLNNKNTYKVSRVNII